MRHSKRGVFSRLRGLIFVKRSKAHKQRLRNEYLGGLFVVFLILWFAGDDLDPLKQFLSEVITIIVDGVKSGFGEWF